MNNHKISESLSHLKSIASNHLIKISMALLVSFIFITSSFSQGNNLIEISGQVINQQTKEPLQSVTVNIKGTIAGTITNSTGNFTLKTKAKFPLKLVFSSVGFQSQEFDVEGIGSTLQIALITQTMLGKEVVVTASRVANKVQGVHQRKK